MRKFWIIRVCAECEEVLDKCQCDPGEWLPDEPPVVEVLVKRQEGEWHEPIMYFDENGIGPEYGCAGMTFRRPEVRDEALSAIVTLGRYSPEKDDGIVLDQIIGIAEEALMWSGLHA